MAQVNPISYSIIYFIYVPFWNCSSAASTLTSLTKNPPGPRGEIHLPVGRRCQHKSLPSVWDPMSSEDVLCDRSKSHHQNLPPWLRCWQKVGMLMATLYERLCIITPQQLSNSGIGGDLQLDLEMFKIFFPISETFSTERHLVNKCCFDDCRFFVGQNLMKLP